MTEQDLNSLHFNLNMDPSNFHLGKNKAAVD